MASAVQTLRIGLCLSRRVSAPRIVAPRAFTTRRTFSSTRPQWRSKKEEDELDEDDDVDVDDDWVPPTNAEYEEWQKQVSPREMDEATKIQEQYIGGTARLVSEATKVPRIRKETTFWSEDEEDPDLITDERSEKDFDEDDIMGMAHDKLEEFREYREYARIAAWQMPLLSKLARPFQPPTMEEPLRFRYTTYMGEFHPAENKVVVEFSPRDMPLNEVQQLKLKKLLGPRFNPETEIAKMSCEQFESQAQNKRYLSDLVNSLVAQARDPADMFEDVPLDTRHHTFKVKPKFPVGWRMTAERRKVIENTRQKALLLDQAKERDGTLINGTEKIQQHLLSRRDAQIPETIKARLQRSMGPPGRRPPMHASR